jgi:hypothetical protein
LGGVRPCDSTPLGQGVELFPMTAQRCKEIIVKMKHLDECDTRSDGGARCNCGYLDILGDLNVFMFGSGPAGPVGGWKMSLTDVMIFVRAHDRHPRDCTIHDATNVLDCSCGKFELLDALEAMNVS